MKAATIRDFEPGAVKSILERSDWAILSAEKNQYSALTNAARTHALCAALAREGYRFTEVEGMYDGRPERAILVLGISERYALQLGESFEQDSILTQRGLVFTNRTYCAGLRVNEVVGSAPDCYSRVLVTGAIFRVELETVRQSITRELEIA